MLEVRHIDALVTVAEERSISRAATRLGYTQSAVSQQIRSLEQIVGVEVIARSPGARTVELTAAGERLLEHAEAIRSRVDAARLDLASFRATIAATVSIGSVPSATRLLVPPVAATLRTRAPEVVLHTEESFYPAELLDRLHAGELDLVIAPVVGEDPGATPLLDDPYVLVVPAGDPLAGAGRPVTADDLHGRDLVSKNCDTLSQRALDAALARLEIHTRTVVRAHDPVTVQELVARGVGIAIVPGLLADPADPAVAVLPLAAVLPPRRIALYRGPAAVGSTYAALVASLVEQAAAAIRPR